MHYHLQIQTTSTSDKRMRAEMYLRICVSLLYVPTQHDEFNVML